MRNRLRIKPERIALYAFYVGIAAWLLAWAGVWALQWWLAPSWLIDSRNGLQSAFQVIPAVIVAVFVLMVGSVLVIAQQIATVFGSRAPLLLPQDQRITQNVARPLLVTIAAVLLAGQVPDDGVPCPAITAAAATLTLATVFIVVRTAVALPLLFLSYLAPVNFAGTVLTNVENYMRDGHVGMVKFRISVFGDMLRSGLRRGDSTAVGVALSRGLNDFVGAYIRATQANPEARRFTYDDGITEDAWLGQQLADTLRNAAEDALLSPAAENDLDSIGRAMRGFAIDFVNAGYGEEATALIEALQWSGTSVHQVSSSGWINLFGKAAEALAGIEAAAEGAGDVAVASRALAAWVVVIAYPVWHFDVEKHRRFEADIALMGPSPPWDEAGEMILSEAFVSRWVNKLPATPEPVLRWLELAREEHARFHGVERPTRPGRRRRKPKP